MADCFPNGTYQLADSDGTLHSGWRLKVYHARLMMVGKDEDAKEEVVPVKHVTFSDAECASTWFFAAADHE